MPNPNDNLLEQPEEVNSNSINDGSVIDSSELEANVHKLMDQLANVDPVEEMADVLKLQKQFSSDEDAPNSLVTTGRHPLIDQPVKIKTLPHHQELPLPEYKTVLASGFDLIAANDTPIFLNTIGASAIIPTGLCFEIPVGFEGQVRPRSGLAAKHGITVTNTPGTIDADYRGEIKVLLTNLTGRRFKVERGMRIAQMVITSVVQVILEEVDTLDETERGSGAFGSTGVT